MEGHGMTGAPVGVCCVWCAVALGRGFGVLRVLSWDLQQLHWSVT